jgi:CheY-like chemotaxis protein
MEGRGLEPALRSSAQESPRSIAKFILVVEDDPDLGQLVAEVLESAGYRTAVAGNGAEALDRLQTIDHPDLILLDMMMPVMNGPAMLQAMAADPGLVGVPVLILSSLPEEAIRLHVRDTIRILQKPYTADQVLHAVARVLDEARDAER